VSEGDWRDLRGVDPPAFDAASLYALYGAFAGIEEAVRTGLPAIPLPSWHTAQGALEDALGLALDTDSLRCLPHAWANFHEPQFTRGFMHFLTEGAASQRQARCRAFVLAALRCAGKSSQLATVGPITAVSAEPEENRIDMLVELEDADGRFGAAIEAKFWHRLTKGQLPKAKRHAELSRRWNLNRSALVVIAPVTDQLDQRMLRTNKDWRATSWWAFLRCFERELEGRHDCDDFRRFRRTIWYHAY